MAVPPAGSATSLRLLANLLGEGTDAEQKRALTLGEFLAGSAADSDAEFERFVAYKSVFLTKDGAPKAMKTTAVAVRFIGYCLTLQR